MTQGKRVNRDAARAALVLLMLALWAISLHQLAVYPPVGEDEPWVASTGWQLAARGVFGSPLFAGLWHMDERYYDFMPLYPMLSALVFRSAGVGLFQARYVSVALGIVLVALTFRLGARLWNPRVGLVSAFVLVAIPLVVLPYSSGSLFLDVARVARYDILVPVTGLGALLLYLQARVTQQQVWYWSAGFCAGLAGLAHLYGAFWIAALLALALSDRAKRAQLVALGIGLLVAPGIYALYVAGGWDSFRAQTQWYGERFDLLNPQWHLSNLVREKDRYQFADVPTAVITYAVFAAGLGTLINATIKDRRSPASVILVSVLVLVAGLAWLVESKTQAYLIIALPLFAVGTAYLFETAGQLLMRSSLRRFWVPAVVMVSCVVIAARTVELDAAARRTIPYRDMIETLRAQVAPPARVLGLHAFWFGLEDVELRDWIVPLQWSTARPGKTPVSMTAALDRLAPDTVVIDPRMRAYLESASNDPRPAQVTAWLRANHFHCALDYNNVTYGRFQVYRRSSTTAHRETIEPCVTH